jgi:nucleoid-associated protein YgaU
VSTPLTAVLNRTAERPAAAPAPAEGDAKNSDWGLAPEKKGMTRENKFILFILLILVSVFSFVVFRNFQKKAEKTDGTETAKEGDEKSESGKTEKSKHAKAEKPKNDDDVILTSETEHNHPRVQDEEGGAESFAASKTKTRSAADEFSEDSTTQKRPKHGETPELTDDPFKNTDDQPAQITEHRTGQKHRTSRAVAEENSLSDKSEGQEPERALTLSAPQESASDSQADDKSFSFKKASEARTETATENNAAVEDQFSRAQSDTIETTPVKRGHRTTPRTRVSEELEGSAEPTELHTASPPKELELARTDDLAATNGFNEGVEQTGGIAEKGQQRIGKKSDPAVARHEELAQTDVSMTTQEVGAETIPRAGHTGSRATGGRNATHQSARGTTAARSVAQEEPMEDKLGGMQPHEVTRRPPAPRGNFDPQIDPLVTNTGDYVIRPNDNYWRISRKVYGTSRYFEALRKHNQKTIGDSKHMKVGDHISTPAVEVLEQQYRDLIPVMAAPKPAGAVFDSPAAPKTSGFFIDTNNEKAYRVGPNDTLSGISQKLLGRSARWDEIYELNKDRMRGYDQLTLGMILRLPEDAVQPKLVGTTDAAR